MLGKAGVRGEFTARYRVESPLPPSVVAELIAGEQSSGTFRAVPGESGELKARARARVVSVQELGEAGSPTLHSALLARKGLVGACRRSEIELAFPIANVGNNLPTLLATVAGNLYELGEVSGLRLLDLDMPAEYAAQFAGPAFGVQGTRQLSGVYQGPMIGTIIKPSVGLSAGQTAALVDQLCEAGIDFVKDDELMADPPYERFSARLAAVMPVLQRHAQRLGRMPMYAINISGDGEEMLRRHDAVREAGGTCVMASINWVGFAGIASLRRHAQLAIHGHRNGWGALARHPLLGLSFLAFQKLWRLAGIDHLHINGVRSKFWEPDDSVIDAGRACLAPFADLAPLMPVSSSGQTPAQAPDLYKGLGSCDVLHLAGAGILAHPDGAAAGVQAMREAWQAAQAGIVLRDYAATRPALRSALSFFQQD